MNEGDGGRPVEEDAVSCGTWAIHTAYTYSRDRKLASLEIHEDIGNAIGPHIKSTPRTKLFYTIGAAIWGILKRIRDDDVPDSGTSPQDDEIDLDTTSRDADQYDAFDPFEGDLNDENE